MGRKIVIRRSNLDTDVSKLEELIRRDFKEIYARHMEELEEAAEQIQADAGYLVPTATGALGNSIGVHVSRSRRYPGLIVSASAKNGRFDYALIQEENESYEHGSTQQGDDGLYEEEAGSAHYLGGPFAIAIRDLYYELTGEDLDLPEELEHAAEYVEDKL